MAEILLDKFVTQLLFRTDTAGLRRMEAAVGRVRQRLDGMAGMATRVGVALTAPLAGIGKAAISTDAAMNRMEASTGASAKQLERFKEQAYEVGSGLPLDTAAIIKAQTVFARLGNTIEETYAAIPGIARFTVAADNVAIADSAKYASIAMNTFNLEASQTEGVLDRLAKIERVTAGTARGVGEAFQYSAANAHAADMSLDEYIGTLGTVAMAGRDVESVSQGLGLFLTNIQRGIAGVGRGSKRVQKVFGEALGISMDEVADTFKGERGFTELLKLIRSRTKGRGEEFLETAMAGLAGTSYSAAFGWLVRNVDMLEDATEDMSTAQGESQRQVDIMLQGISGAWIKFRAMIDTFVNRMADWFISEPMEQMLNKGGQLLTWLTTVDEKGGPAAKRFVQLIGYALLAGPALLGLALALKTLSFMLLPVAPLLRGASLAVVGLTKATRGLMMMVTNPRAALGGIFKLLPMLLGVIGGPVGLAAIALLAAAAAGIVLFWKPISTFVKGALQGLISGFKEAIAPGGRLREALKKLWEAAKNLAEAFGPPVEKMLAFISGARDADETVTGMRFGQFLVDALVGIVNAITWVIDAWAWYVQALSDAGWFDFVNGLIMFFINGLKGIYDNVEALIDFFKDVASGENVFQAGQTLIRTFLSGMLSMWTPLLDGAKSLISGTIGKLLPGSDAELGPLSRLTESGRALVDTFGGGIRAAAPGLANAFREALPVLGGITAPLPVAPRAAPAAAGGINLTLNVDRVDISAPGGDMDRIKAGIADALGDGIRQAVEQYDTRYR